MILSRLPYEPSALLSFYEDGLGALRALCERTWHDRLEVVAEGPAARLWNPEGALQEIELFFAPADATTARDASHEVFPGCPLTFRLAEMLRPAPLALERIILAPETKLQAPDLDVAEKLWRTEFPDTTRWRLATPFKPCVHFSLLGLVRAEVQAIDQHWSAHRLACALPGGEPDESLARDISFARTVAELPEGATWPAPDPTRLRDFLRLALEADLSETLSVIRQRQERYLKREIDRIDDYFENYERELTARSRRNSSESAKLKTADRLAAAQAEHGRRRSDQVVRHEIRVAPHVDELLVVAEPAWSTSLNIERTKRSQTVESAQFVPRARRWFAQVT
jgi:hypothetical protein